MLFRSRHRVIRDRDRGRWWVRKMSKDLEGAGVGESGKEGGRGKRAGCGDVRGEKLRRLTSAY